MLKVVIHVSVAVVRSSLRAEEYQTNAKSYSKQLAYAVWKILHPLYNNLGFTSKDLWYSAQVSPDDYEVSEGAPLLVIQAEFVGDSLMHLFTDSEGGSVQHAAQVDAAISTYLANERIHTPHGWPRDFIYTIPTGYHIEARSGLALPH